MSELEIRLMQEKLRRTGDWMNFWLNRAKESRGEADRLRVERDEARALCEAWQDTAKSCLRSRGFDLDVFVQPLPWEKHD